MANSLALSASCHAEATKPLLYYKAMLHRAFFPILLMFAMLFSQQASVWHQISHVTDYAPSSQLAAAQSSTPAQPDQSPHTDFCDRCLGFAQLASAVHSSYFVPLLIEATFDVIIIDLVTRYSTTHTQYTARAPPAFSL